MTTPTIRRSLSLAKAALLTTAIRLAENCQSPQPDASVSFEYCLGLNEDPWWYFLNSLNCIWRNLLVLSIIISWITTAPYSFDTILIAAGNDIVEDIYQFLRCGVQRRKTILIKSNVPLFVRGRRNDNDYPHLSAVCYKSGGHVLTVIGNENNLAV